MTDEQAARFGAYFVSCLRDERLQLTGQLYSAMREFADTLGLDDAEFRAAMIREARRVQAV